MCLAELYGCMWIVFVYGSIYTISSINHCKERWWISRVSKMVQKCMVIFFCFLKNMFWSKNISSNTIYCYKKSPLSLWAFSTEECGIEDENREVIGGYMRIETNDVLFFGYLYLSSEYSSELSMYGFNRNSRIICELSKGLFMEWIFEEELMIFLDTNPTFILKYMTTVFTTKTLFLVSFSILDDRRWGTFWTLFIHKNKIERINLSIMQKSQEKTHIKMSIKPKLSLRTTKKNPR